MPRKKRCQGFFKRKIRGSHLLRGYVPKKSRFVDTRNVADQKGDSPANKLRVNDQDSYDSDHEWHDRYFIKNDGHNQMEGHVVQGVCNVGSTDHQEGSGQSSNAEEYEQKITIKSEISSIYLYHPAGSLPDYDTQIDVQASFEAEPIKTEIVEFVSTADCDDDVMHNTRGFESPDPLSQEENMKDQDPELQELLLQEASVHVRTVLLSHWLCAVTNGKLTLGYSSPVGNVPFAIQRAVTVTPAGEVEVFVHNKPLSSSHKFWNSVQKVPLLQQNVQLFSENIVNITKVLRRYEICEGIENFERTWQHCALGFEDTNPFLEKRYSRTFRSYKCLYLVDNLRFKRCRECRGVHNILRQRNARLQNQTDDPPPSDKGNEFLTPPQLKSKLDSNRKTIRNLREQNNHLISKLRNLPQTDGVDTYSELSDEFSSSLSDSEN